MNSKDKNEIIIQNTIWRLPQIYINVESLGHGGFGSVCSAFDNNRNDLVVLKKLTRPFESKQHAKRTYREIALLKHVSHNNIIQLINIFCDAEHYQNLNDIYLVTSYMEMTLHDRLYKINKELEDDYIMIYMYQILNGLNYLHSCNIIHRDLKPSNITITDRELKIIDLGLARQENFEMTGYIATRWYRAPEIIFKWQRYSRLIDVWSAGCVLAEMYIKRPMFKSQSASEHLSLIIKTVGYPNESQLNEWDEYAKKFILQFSNIPVTSIFSENFPEIDPCNETKRLAIDLIFNMLKLDPNERFSILQALKDPFLGRYYSEEDEHFDSKIFNDDHENIDYNISEWKQLIFNEITCFKNFNNLLHTDEFNEQEIPS